MINASKNTIRRTAVAASLLIAGFAMPAFADKDSVVAGCSAGGDCASLVRAEVAGKSDSEIADLVLALSGAANTRGCSSLASGINVAADSVSDSEQSQRIRRIAGSLCTNQITTASVDNEDPDHEPHSASPN